MRRNLFFTFFYFVLLLHTYADTKQINSSSLQIDWAFLSIVYKLNAHEPLLNNKYLYTLENDNWKYQKILKEKAQDLLENTIFDSTHLVKDYIYDNSDEEIIASYQIFWEKIFQYEIPSYLSLYSEYSFSLLGRNGLLSYLPMRWTLKSYYELNPENKVVLDYAHKKAYQKKHLFSMGNFIATWTGLLILVPRNFAIMPAISPKVLSQNGQIIYGAEFLSSKIGNIKGVLRYVDNVSSPLVLKTVGKNPLIVSIISVQGNYPVNLVLSTKDANKIFQEVSLLKLLKNAKIVVVKQ